VIDGGDINEDDAAATVIWVHAPDPLHLTGARFQPMVDRQLSIDSVLRRNIYKLKKS
jgi:hypothetical protein